MNISKVLYISLRKNAFIMQISNYYMPLCNEQRPEEISRKLPNYETASCLISLLTSRRPQFGFIVQSESIYHVIDNRIALLSLNCKVQKEIQIYCTWEKRFDSVFYLQEVLFMQNIWTFECVLILNCKADRRFIGEKKIYFQILYKVEAAVKLFSLFFHKGNSFTSLSYLMFHNYKTVVVRCQNFWL